MGSACLKAGTSAWVDEYLGWIMTGEISIAFARTGRTMAAGEAVTDAEFATAAVTETGIALGAGLMTGCSVIVCAGSSTSNCDMWGMEIGDDGSLAAGELVESEPLLPKADLANETPLLTVAAVAAEAEWMADAAVGPTISSSLGAA